MAKNSKVKKIIAAIAIVGVAAGAIFGGLALANHGGGPTPGPTPGPGPSVDPNPPIVEVQQLDTVQNIQYTKDGYKFTWDDVANADSYNIKVTSEGLSANDIRTNEFGYYPQDSSKDIKVQVQAVDSTGEYNKSEWSEEQTFTFQEQSTIMSSIMDYAKGEVNGDLTGFISAYATTDLKGAHHLTMHLTSKVNGEDKLSVVHGDIAPGTDISSLEEIVKSSPETYFPEEYFIAENSVGETINSMEYLLQSDMNGTGLKSNYINRGYDISVLSSYTALDEGDTAGKNFTIYSVVKATRGDEEKLLHVTYDCRVNDLSSSLEKNVTRGLLGNRYLKETGIKELTGDFAEAAQLSSNVNSNVQTTSYNPSYYSNDDGMSY